MVAVWKPELQEEMVLMLNLGHHWNRHEDAPDGYYVTFEDWKDLGNAAYEAWAEVERLADDKYDLENQIDDLSDIIAAKDKEIEKLEKQLEEILNQ